jgi:hypothetical protein
MKKPHTTTEEKMLQAAIVLDNADGDEEVKSYLNFAHDKMLETYDFDLEPSLSAKRITSYSKNKILLDVWNQFIAHEEAYAEQVLGVFAVDYFGHMRRIDVVKNFASYLEGYLESYDEPCDECKCEIKQLEEAENLMEMFKPEIGLS